MYPLRPVQGQASCRGPWQKLYSKYHAKVLRSPSQGSYLVYLCYGQRQSCGGLGNRIQAITSLFYLALLTNRTFLLHWGGPGELSDFLRPNFINWDFPMAFLEKKLTLSIHTTYWGVYPPPRKHDVMRIESFEEFGNWSRKANFLSLLSEPVEAIGSIWSFAHLLQENPFLQQSARALGLPPNDPALPYHMVGCAFDFLFKTSPALQRGINQMMSSFFRSTTPIIGIHIRTSDHHFGHNSNYSYRSRNSLRFFTCAQKMEENIRRHKAGLTKPFTWFMAADDDKLKKYAQRSFSREVLTLDIVPRHIEYSSGQSDMIRDALLDIFLLSRCDYLVVTAESSFSELALAIGKHSKDKFIQGEECNLKYTSLDLDSSPVHSNQSTLTVGKH